ncbi:TPA: hypothetical protein KRM58_003506 [Clostridioides difficile]|nr:hypothetical protein [Clostridioides difficile]HBH1802287.1 hypothetical protein [Clostridioides difficile]
MLTDVQCVIKLCKYLTTEYNNDDGVVAFFSDTWQRNYYGFNLVLNTSKRKIIINRMNESIKDVEIS